MASGFSISTPVVLAKSGLRPQACGPRLEKYRSTLRRASALAGLRLMAWPCNSCTVAIGYSPVGTVLVLVAWPIRPQAGDVMYSPV